jgi:Host cell surface-exposed lipoprotein
MSTPPSTGNPSTGWQPPSPQQPRKNLAARHTIWTAIYAYVRTVKTTVSIAGLATALAITSCSSPRTSQTAANSSASTYAVQPPPASSPTPASSPAAPQYTVAQQQAIASAQNYLSMGQGFSKAGLIKQLHSRYGEGFSRKLAIFAVKHVKVNWFHQAVLSAKGYMKTQPGWSYSGLVQQLSSQYGEQFTVAQAQYAAKAVGL